MPALIYRSAQLKVYDVIISGDRKFIFIHVPKTGGLSIRRFLQASSSDVRDIFFWHVPAKHAKKVIHGWESYFRFGFVRNPWEVQVSMYNYILGMGNQHPEWQEVERCSNFRTYIDRYMRNNWENGNLITQSDMLFDDQDYCLVSLIGRFDTFTEDFEKACREMGIAMADLPWLNRSEHGEYRSYYDENAKSLVAKIYSRDLDLLKYAF
jgi:hypothetical protein